MCQILDCQISMLSLHKSFRFMPWRHQFSTLIANFLLRRIIVNYELWFTDISHHFVHTRKRNCIVNIKDRIVSCISVWLHVLWDQIIFVNKSYVKRLFIRHSMDPSIECLVNVRICTSIKEPTKGRELSLKLDRKFPRERSSMFNNRLKSDIQVTLMLQMYYKLREMSATCWVTLTLLVRVIIKVFDGCLVTFEDS